MEKPVASSERIRWRPLLRVEAKASVLDAARAMHEWGGDAVVVVNGDNAVVGVFTPRDVVRVVALGLEPRETLVGNWLLSPCRCGECRLGAEAWLG